MITLLEAQAVLADSLNGIEWTNQDDRCDCVFQRIGYWHNPYIGETLEVRMCCIWAELYKQFPDFVRVTKQEPAIWNGESDMPNAIWHRQLANHLHVSVAEARRLAGPAPVGKKVEPVRPFIVLISGEEVVLDLSRITWT